jgi:peptidylprolyl isomerase
MFISIVRLHPQYNLEVTMTKISRILAAILILGLVTTGCSAAPDPSRAKNGDTVQVHYTGTLADGTTFDSSAGRDPLEFVLGSGQTIPGFEKAVLGMKAGEKKTVTIPANEAYGPPNPQMILEISRTNLPAGMTPQVGQQMRSTSTEGRTIVATIIKVSENTVTLDANHPLAGKDLTFEIALVKIK